MGVAQRKLSQCATMNTVRTHQIEAYQQSEFVPGHKYRFLNALLCPYHKFTKTGYAKALGKMQPPARLGLHSRPHRQADASVAKPNDISNWATAWEGCTQVTQACNSAGMQQTQCEPLHALMTPKLKAGRNCPPRNQLPLARKPSSSSSESEKPLCASMT